MFSTKDANLKPVASTLSLILEGSARVGDLRTAKNTLKELSSKGMIPTDTGYISAVYVHALNRNTEVAFNLLEDWKKKRHHKHNRKKVRNVFQSRGAEDTKYGWPGFAVSKILLDSLTYDVDHLRTPLSLSGLLEKVTCILEMAYNNEGIQCAHSVRAHLRTNRLLLKLVQTKKSMDFLWKRPQLEMFDHIEKFIVYLDEK